MNDKIKDLQQQIEVEKRKISNCKHEFGKEYSNPYQVSEPVLFKLVGQGSDVWSEPTGWNTTTNPRWTRKCKLCGFEQHTENQEPIVTGFKPSFK